MKAEKNEGREDCRKGGLEGDEGRREGEGRKAGRKEGR